jgi:hypothetical protein
MGVTLVGGEMDSRGNIERGLEKLKEFEKIGHFILDKEVFLTYFWKRFQSPPETHQTVCCLA